VIYSKFGTKLTPISKKQDYSGRLSIEATAGGTQDLREYHVDDLKADQGPMEISQIVDGLPWKIAPKRTSHDERRLRWAAAEAGMRYAAP